MSRPIGLQTSTPLKMKFQFILRPCCQMPFSQSGHRLLGPHPQSAFLPRRKGRCCAGHGLEVPGLHSSRQQQAQCPVSPGHFRDPPSLTLHSHTLPGLPQHHTHCLSPAPSSETLPHQPSFPVGPWRVSLSACHPNSKSVTPPGPHYAQGWGGSSPRSSPA